MVCFDRLSIHQNAGGYPAFQAPKLNGCGIVTRRAHQKPAGAGKTTTMKKEHSFWIIKPLEEDKNYSSDQHDEHGWVNPAVSLCVWIVSIAAIGAASIIIYALSL